MKSHESIKQSHQLIMNEETLEQARTYKAALEKKSVQAGKYLARRLAQSEQKIDDMSLEDFLGVLINTRLPRLYAEDEAYLDGKNDWNQTEYAILGGISTSIQAKAFDKGQHTNQSYNESKRPPLPERHSEPMDVLVGFVSGALFETRIGDEEKATRETPERKMILDEKTGEINDEKFFEFYEKRLLPTLLHMNAAAASEGKKAFITIPAIGCGAFAGTFRGKLELKVQAALERILQNHGDKLKDTAAICYVPYGKYEEKEISTGKEGNPLLLVKPSQQQLRRPDEYDAEKFKDCKFEGVALKSCTISAGDPLSWPGNEGYVCFRQTVDGVISLATNICSIMTEHPGVYETRRYWDEDKKAFRYDTGYHPHPPVVLKTIEIEGEKVPVYQGWNHIIKQKGLTIKTEGRIHVVTQSEGFKLLQGNVYATGQAVKISATAATPEPTHAVTVESKSTPAALTALLSAAGYHQQAQVQASAATTTITSPDSGESKESKSSPTAALSETEEKEKAKIEAIDIVYFNKIISSYKTELQRINDSTKTPSNTEESKQIHDEIQNLITRWEKHCLSIARKSEMTGWTRDTMLKELLKSITRLVQLAHDIGEMKYMKTDWRGRPYEKKDDKTHQFSDLKKKVSTTLARCVFNESMTLDQAFEEISSRAHLAAVIKQSRGKKSVFFNILNPILQRDDKEGFTKHRNAADELFAKTKNRKKP